MDNMAELLEFHEMVHFNRLGLANPIDIISCQIDQHDVLGAILLRREEYGTQLLVL